MLNKLTSTLRNLIVSTIVSVIVLVIGIVLVPVYAVFGTVIITLASLAVLYFGYALIKYIKEHRPEKKEKTVKTIKKWQDYVLIAILVGIVICIILGCRSCGYGDTVHFTNATVDNFVAGNAQIENVVADTIETENLTANSADITDAFIGNSYTDYQHADEFVAETYVPETPVDDEPEQEEPNPTPDVKPSTPVVTPEVSTPAHECTFKVEKKEATCVTEGYQVEVCSCGKEQNRTVIAKLTHNFNSGEVTTKATEEATGILTKTCVACGATTTETIAKLSHTHKVDDNLTKREEATCSENGYVRLYCKCGELISEQTLAKTTKHKWDDGEITREPTENRTGVITYTCKKCGESTTEKLDKLEHKHDYDWVVVEEPTCEDGYEECICKDCGDVKKTRSIDATEDCKYRVIDEREPTSKRDGYVEYECRYCGDTYTETLPATGEDEEKPNDNHNNLNVIVTASSTSIKSGETVVIETTGSASNLKLMTAREQCNLKVVDEHIAHLTLVKLLEGGVVTIYDEVTNASVEVLIEFIYD